MNIYLKQLKPTCDGNILTWLWHMYKKYYIYIFLSKGLLLQKRLFNNQLLLGYNVLFFKELIVNTTNKQNKNNFVLRKHTKLK